MGEIVYDTRDMVWILMYEGERIVSISDEYVKENVERFDGLISSYESFRMLVGAWLLSCIQTVEKDFATKAWLTKMSSCAIH